MLLCRALLAWSDTNTPEATAARWQAVVAELKDHLTLEEDLMIPAYARDYPEDAANLLASHRRIRELIEPSHVITNDHEARLERLVVLLATHMAHEEEGLYPWIERNIDATTKRRIVSRVERYVY